MRLPPYPCERLPPGSISAAVRDIIQDEMRVLAVIDTLEVGGAQCHLLTLARGGHRFGCRLAVATSGREPLAGLFEKEGVPVFPLLDRSIKHRLSPTFTWRLSRLAEHGPYDLIHAHSHSASLAAVVAARISGLPLVVTQHSMNTWQSPLDRALRRWVHRRAEVVVAVAGNTAAQVEGSGVEPTIIRNGVAMPVPWSQREIEEARVRLGVPREAYVVSYVGRLSEEKDPLLFVEVAELVALRCPNAHFLVIGHGPLRADVGARIRARGLVGRFTCTGILPDAGVLLQAVDVLVVTSRSEACPLVVLEAMAAGRPVVSTAVGDVPRQIEHEVTGYIAGIGDSEALADGVVTLADPCRRDQFGAAARAWAGDHYSVARMLEETMSVYKGVLRYRAPGPARRV